jgi:hypothetical protein
MTTRFFKAFFLAMVFSLLAPSLQAQTAKSDMPKELIGHWQIGTFAMSNFWNPTTGQYVGNANEASRSYRFAADGTAEEFFIANTTSYNCRTQILGYRKGTLRFSSDGKSFTFCPSSGYYRTANCFKKEWTKKEYGVRDLCPTYQVTYYWQVEDGTLVVKETPESSKITTYRKIEATQ